MQRAGNMTSMRAHMTPARLALRLGGPTALAVASWVYLSVMINDMSTMPGMSAMMMRVFSPMQFFELFLMWAVMMAAMMLPTAAPMITAYARMQGADRARGAGWLPVFAFSAGYVLAWAGFSLAAAGLQAGFTNLAIMSPMMMRATGPLAGAILVVAGLYQFSPVKHACLRQCRTPISFLMTQWREGSWGALGMGWRHGLFCVGCCWAMMGLLFVVGVMNAAWIIAITIYVLVEKIVPGAELLSKAVGVALVGMGLWTLI
jgi:predicted metal-binding membrane protein